MCKGRKESERKLKFDFCFSQRVISAPTPSDSTCSWSLHVSRGREGAFCILVIRVIGERYGKRDVGSWEHSAGGKSQFEFTSNTVSRRGVRLSTMMWIDSYWDESPERVALPTTDTGQIGSPPFLFSSFLYYLSGPADRSSSLVLDRWTLEYHSLSPYRDKW